MNSQLVRSIVIPIDYYGSKEGSPRLEELVLVIKMFISNVVLRWTSKCVLFYNYKSSD